MEKKLIIFDMDGVLVDSTGVVSKYFMQWHPTLTNKYLQEMLCGNFHDELEKMKLIHPPIVETEEVREARRTEYIKTKATCPLYDGILDLVRTLHAHGNILAINTSALTQNSLPLLEKIDITKYFDVIATAEMSKSKTEKFAILEKKYGLSKNEIIFITDTLGDVKEAEVAGIKTIAVTYGAHDKKYFEREPHTNLVAIVDTVDELKKELMK